MSTLQDYCNKAEEISPHLIVQIKTKTEPIMAGTGTFKKLVITSQNNGNKSESPWYLGDDISLKCWLAGFFAGATFV